MNDKTRTVLELLEEDGRCLHLLLVRLTLREDVAEDLMQELFIKLQKSDGLLQAKNQHAYARQAAIHLAFDWRRRHRKRKDRATLESEPTSDEPSPLASLSDREEFEQILAALDSISELPRTCVLLRYLQHQDYDAIAEQVGKTAHQVRGLCHKALKKLRELLQVTTVL